MQFLRPLAGIRLGSAYNFHFILKHYAHTRNAPVK